MTDKAAMSDVAGIVKGLTKAQREAVLALHGDAYKTWPEGRLARMMDGLGKRGLLDLRDAGLAAKGPPWRLTPLGLAVRDQLMKEKAL